jgi:hypothetical protein
MSKLFKTEVPFGMVPNSLLNDENISLKAKGLFAFMQSKPQGWNFSVEGMAFQLKEAKSAISSALIELEKIGFISRKKQQTAKGFVTNYKLFFEKPTTDFPTLENPILEKPKLEKPMVGKSVNISKKDISNKELSNKEERESALAFFKNNFPTAFENLMMQHKSRINDFVKFSEMFEATVEQEGLVYEQHVLSGRFKKFARNWIDNQDKFDNKVIDLNANLDTKKEKIGGFA